MSQQEHENGFGEYRRLLFHRLEEQKEELVAIKHELHQLTIDVATLKVKAGLWGAVAGVLPALGMLILHFLYT